MCSDHQVSIDASHYPLVIEFVYMIKTFYVWYIFLLELFFYFFNNLFTKIIKVFYPLYMIY